MADPLLGLRSLDGHLVAGVLGGVLAEPPESAEKQRDAGDGQPDAGGEQAHGMAASAAR
nr:hypothetical protein [uncultured Roseococcus sp.]